MELAGNGTLGEASLQAIADDIVLARQFDMGAFPSLGASQAHSLRSLPCQRLLRPLGNEIAFDFGGQAEGKRQHLGTDILAKPIVVLDGPDLDFVSHAFVQNAHDHHQAAPQTRQFCADEHIAFLHLVKHLAQLALLRLLCARDGLIEPNINVDVLAFAEAIDFEPLILHGLLVCADPNVPVKHDVFPYV